MDTSVSTFLIIIAAMAALASLIIGSAYWLATRIPRCTERAHSFSKWVTASVKSNTHSNTKIVQARVCQHCGFTQHSDKYV